MYYISLSGGISSTITAILAKENNLDFEMIFADTKIEDPDLYRFLDDTEKVIGKKIIRIEDGRNPWQLFKDMNFVGNSRVGNCSVNLKTKVVKEYIKSVYKEGDILVLGMDSSELDRIERAQKIWFPIAVESLLTRYKIYRTDYDDILNRYSLKKPSLYDYGFPHNNCGGFCVRAGQTQFASLLKYFPERYNWHEENQEALMESNPNTKPFIKYTRSNITKYLTLKEFRYLVQNNLISVPLYDYGGCGCFIDDDLFLEIKT